MNTLHTPGPWTLETVRTQVGICHKVGPFPWRDGKQNHACIYADHARTGALEAELLANARLIVAAPDMLAVLLKLRRGDLHQRARHLYDEAQAAIAIAIGETTK